MALHFQDEIVLAEWLWFLCGTLMFPLWLCLGTKQLVMSTSAEILWFQERLSFGNNHRRAREYHFGGNVYAKKREGERAAQAFKDYDKFIEINFLKMKEAVGHLLFLVPLH
jgi:hypothetical protein